MSVAFSGKSASPGALPIPVRSLHFTLTAPGSLKFEALLPVIATLGKSSARAALRRTTSLFVGRATSEIRGSNVVDRSTELFLNQTFANAVKRGEKSYWSL